MKKKRRATIIAGSVLLLLASVNAQAKGGQRVVEMEHEGGEFLPGADQGVSLFPDHPELGRRFGEASIIRMAYAALEKAIAESGYLVEFELADFRTYYRREFDRLQVRELVTLDLPLRLEVRQTEVTGAGGSVVGHAFTPRWVERYSVEDLDEMREFMNHYRDFTLADALRHPEADDSHRQMVAVTSYRVEVNFEGQSQSYRAAFKWITGAPGEVTFIAEDHVTEGVERALVADGEVAPIPVLLGRSLGEQRDRRQEEEE